MKKTYFVISTVALILFAVIDFLKNVLEAHLHIQLITALVSYNSRDYYVDSRLCQTVLLIVAFAGIILFAMDVIREYKNK